MIAVCAGALAGIVACLIMRSFEAAIEHPIKL
jgi:hypothetical protein